jgi:ATP-dependent RNA helicase DHX29
MAAGNKKKKKPAANPARGFATTSIQSKSKADETPPTDSADASGIITPATKSDPQSGTGNHDTGSSTTTLERELHELSPEELESQLETTELQQIVDNHSTKVRKEASRQASRLVTEKRLLRGNSEFLSVKAWLPDELMLEIQDLTVANAPDKEQSVTRPSAGTGEDLIAKVWTLRSILVDLGFTLDMANEAVSHVLQHSTDETQGLIWGIASALDWLGRHCEPEELSDYDTQPKKALRHATDDGIDGPGDQREGSLQGRSPDSGYSRSVNGDADGVAKLGNTIEVSDLDSDMEPDELLSVYLQTKARLFEINPEVDVPRSKKGNAKRDPNGTQSNAIQTTNEQRLSAKLRKIERDVLFDQREADTQWAVKKIELAKDAAERRKLLLSSRGGEETSDRPAKGNRTPSDDTTQEVEEPDDLDILGGMFNALPTVLDLGIDEPAAQGSNHAVTVRDFGRLTGITPRRILEEACRARDSRCKFTYRQVSPSTFSCRYSISIFWEQEQEIPDSSYLQSVSAKQRARQLMVTMESEATPEVLQAEAYVATAALFIIFSHSPKEEKTHLRLPPAYRNLWDEFTALKQRHSDAADRETVKELRELIERVTSANDDDDDEVVYNVSKRYLSGTPSGASTPISRPQTPRPGMSESSQALKDIWARKIASASYQRMLPARTNLPMYHSKLTAIETIEQHQVAIVVGDTGSGKSTQVPQFILEHELSQGRQCKIYCTEPRRISAISLAQRVSEELGEQKRDLGTSRSLVGYAIRLESHTVSQTRLVYATVGIVLRMLENADGLKEITHLVLDEVHERSIDTDFLLIVLQNLIVQRPDLKVVLMSATVDAQKFSQYLGGVPIISVPGRTFPVEARFLEDAIELTGYHSKDGDEDVRNAAEDEDIDSEDREKTDTSNQLTGYCKQTVKTLSTYDEYKVDHTLIVKLLEKISQDPQYMAYSRATLIFMPGIAEIRQLNDILLGHPSFSSKEWRVHALHSTFSTDEQQAAFEVPPEGMRKIVIATNIAETGITIPDITCVIDSGKHREMRYDERRQISKLTQSFISRANAKQRRGRAGRVQEGICFHLFTKYRFENLMMEQQTPEMLRLSLQDLVMRVKICKLGDIEEALASALDPPSSKNVRRAIDALMEVGALNAKEQLTSLGSQLAKLPLDAQLGKFVLYGANFGCLDFALTVAATLTSKSPFLSPMHAKKQADSVRLGFKRGDSDLLTLYNAYSAWRRVCATPGLSEYHFCSKNFLSPQNLANIEDLKGQLLTALVDANFVALGNEDRAALSKLRPGSRHRNFVTLPGRYRKADDNDTFASSVVAWSLYPKILKQEGKGWRNIANNQTLALHPTSVNKVTLSPDVKYLSFYSIMQSSSRFTNAQETTSVSDFALVLLAGDAVFHMYAGVIVIDGSRLKFKVRDWKTMMALKVLRTGFKEALGRLLKYPGRALGDRQRSWMELVERIFEPRKQ